MVRHDPAGKPMSAPEVDPQRTATSTAGIVLLALFRQLNRLLLIKKVRHSYFIQSLGRVYLANGASAQIRPVD
jgi:hypothetical protein